MNLGFDILHLLLSGQQMQHLLSIQPDLLSLPCYFPSRPTLLLCYFLQQACYPSTAFSVTPHSPLVITPRPSLLLPPARLLFLHCLLYYFPQHGCYPCTAFSVTSLIPPVFPLLLLSPACLLSLLYYLPKPACYPCSVTPQPGCYPYTTCPLNSPQPDLLSFPGCCWMSFSR